MGSTRRDAHGSEPTGQNKNQIQNQPDLDSALRTLAGIGYVRSSDGSSDGAPFVSDIHLSKTMKPARSSSSDPKASQLREEYWGKPRDDNTAEFQISWWGKILALVVLRSAVSCAAERQEMRSDVFAKSILIAWNERIDSRMKARATGSEAKAADKLNEDLLKHTLSLMFTFGSKPIRKFLAGEGERLYRAVAWYSARQIKDFPRDELFANRGAEEIYKGLAQVGNDTARDPESFFWMLCDALHIREEVQNANKPRKNLVDRGLFSPRDRADGSRSDEYVKIARQIIDKFCQTAQAPEKIVGLKGNPHAGKKSVVSELLAELSDTTSGVAQFTCPADKRPMPVIGVDLRSRNYRALIQTVHERLQLAAGHIDDDRHTDIAGTLQCIEKLHEKRPTLFIFVDVEGISPSDPRRLLQKRGFRRLLTTLRESNSDSRFLITSSEAKEFDRDPRLRDVNWIHVQDPTVHRLEWYLSRRGAGHLKLLIEAAQLPDVKHKLTGNGLLALAALEPVDDDTFDTAFLEIINSYVDLSRDRGLPQGVAFAFDKLVAHLKGKGLLPAVTLISLSYDGLGEYSLLRCLEWWAKWARHDHKLDPSLQDQKEHIQLELNALHESVRSLILRFGPSVNYEPDEFGFDEKILSNTDGRPNTWSVPTNISHEILRAIARLTNDGFDGNEFLRNAQRTIAFASRRRAQFKKMRSKKDDPFFANDDIGRDVQSYVALLGSIDPAAISNANQEHLSPTYQLKKVFCIGPDFSPRLALIFGVQSILKHDIDFDHRLSMVTDQDSLRLRLYLLPFIHLSGDRSEPFTTQTLTSTQLEVLLSPLDSVPELLVEVLGPDAVVDLLSTIAITAYYCLEIPALSWAAKRITEVSGAEDSALKRALIRIYLAMIDTSLHCGEWRFGDLDERLFGPDLKFETGIRGINQRLPILYSKAWGTDLDQTTETVGFPLKVWARFQIRKIECMWHLEEDIRPLLLALRAQEDKAAQLPQFGSTQLITGRSARKLMRVVSDDLPVWSDTSLIAEVDETLTLLATLLETNISRLVRFAGAERVGVLLDQARFYLLENESPERIRAVMKEAWQRADNGSISTAMRLELMAFEVATALVSVDLKTEKETIQSPAGMSIESIKESLQSLHELALSLGMKPMELAARNLGRRIIEAFGPVIRDFERSSWPGAQESAAQIKRELNSIGLHRAATLVGSKPRSRG